MRIMRLLVMFDLPTKTKADKDNYIKFKRFLDDDGYQREQNSVYSRNLLSRASSESHKLEMVSKINQRTINNNDNTDVEKLSSNQE